MLIQASACEYTAQIRYKKGPTDRKRTENVKNTLCPLCPVGTASKDANAISEFVRLSDDTRTLDTLNEVSLAEKVHYYKR